MCFSRFYTNINSLPLFRNLQYMHILIYSLPNALQKLLHKNKKFPSVQIQRNILELKSKCNYHFTYSYAKINHVDKYNERRNSLEETKYTYMKTAQTNKYTYCIYTKAYMYIYIYLSISQALLFPRREMLKNENHMIRYEK